MKKHLTIPNIVTISRVLFLPLLFLFIQWDKPVVFLITYIILGSTDFIDGKLARKLNQVSSLGKALDSICDLIFYLSSAWFIYVLFKQYLEPNMMYLWVLFIVIGLSFVISTILFKKPIMMHTSLLRLNAVLLYFVVIFSSFGLNTTLFIRFVILLYMLGFIESIAIFIKYGFVDPDTTSIFALMNRKQEE